MQPTTLSHILLLSGAILAVQTANAQEVSLSHEQVARLEIKLEPVRKAETEALAVVAGTVVPPVNARIVATAPFAGTVTAVLVLPGQRVRKGEPLARVSSRELLEAQSELSQAEAELQMADAAARRKRSLVDKNFQSPVVAEEAEGQVAKVQAVIERHRNTLSLHQITIGLAGDYIITAPADGVVVQANAMPGDKVEAMAPSITLDTGSALWVEVQVPAHLVSALKAGDSIQVADGPQGHIVSVGTSLDGLTRSATAYAELPANSGLISGQLVSITIARTATARALSVPRGAVTRVDDKNSVFLRTETGFSLRKVELRGQSRNAATVIGDLPLNAQVAASGLPQLEQLMAER